MAPARAASVNAPGPTSEKIWGEPETQLPDERGIIPVGLARTQPGEHAQTGAQYRREMFVYSKPPKSLLGTRN
jgi:hypothetical protein